MIQPVLSKIHKAYAGDFSKVLLHTGVATYGLSSAGQVFAIVKNNTTDEHEKRYMIHQEIAEGAMNIVLFYTVCKFIKDKTEKMLQEGEITTKSIRELMEKKGVKKVENIDDFIESCLKTAENNKKKSVFNAREELKMFKPCVRNVAACVAGVLASVIIAPLFRNVVAGYFYKKENTGGNIKDYYRI